MTMRSGQLSIRSPWNPALLKVTVSGSVVTEIVTPSRTERHRRWRRVRSSARFSTVGGNAGAAGRLRPRACSAWRASSGSVRSHSSTGARRCA
jgi:hypothetical protein